MHRLIRSGLLAVIALAFVVPMHAQDVVGGVLSGGSNFGQTGGYTIINLDTPFNTDGTITSVTATFDYFGGNTACSASDQFKVRVFRPNVSNAYVLVAEAGPFHETRGNVTQPISIAVKRGDLLGIALFGPGQCGVTGTYSTKNHLVEMFGDYSSGLPSYFVDIPGSTPNLRASSVAGLALVGTLPGAGVTAGAAGSSFNTSLSITNPTSSPMTLTFNYRPVGTGSPVSTTLAIPAGGSRSPKLTDLLSVSGVGSIDVYTNAANPVLNARVYNDTGSGTNGFTEPLVAPNDVAHEFDRLWLTIPSDLSAFRMNVGVRTFSNGAQMSCVVLNASGSTVSGTTKVYAPNTTTLETLQSFFGNDATALSAGGSVQCVVAQVPVKSDIVLYATVTDNRTNDSAMFFAEKH